MDKRCRLGSRNEVTDLRTGKGLCNSGCGTSSLQPDRQVLTPRRDALRFANSSSGEPRIEQMRWRGGGPQSTQPPRRPPENRSHADCRVIPNDVPIAAHVAPSALARCTKRERLFSTCAPAAAIRGRLASTPDRSRSSSHDVSPGGRDGGLAMIWLQRSTHSLQM